MSAALSSVLPWLLRLAIDALRGGAPPGRLWRLAGAMVGLALVGGALRYWMRELLNGISRWIEFDLRNDLFRHLATLDARFYGSTRTGDIMARLTNDLGAVRMAVGPAIMYLMNTIAGGLFALGFMLRIDVQLTVLALLPMLLLPPAMLWLGRAIHERFEAVQAHFGTVTTLVQENLAGVRVVRAYRQEAAEVERFDALNEQYLAKNMRLAQLYGIMHPSMSLLAGLGAVVVLGLGGQLALRGVISVGSFVAFGFYLGILTWPLIALGWVTNLFQRGAASMARLAELLDQRPAIAAPATPRTLPELAPGVTGRTLEFRDVGFHYPSSGVGRTASGESASPSSAAAPDAARPTPDDSSPDAGRPTPDERWVLRHVSFTVPAGATLGVVGATGSGKSALLDLIPRLWDPQEGEILLDGVPIRALDLRTLRGEIGYVPQESFLFSDTIGANVGYGIAEESVDGTVTDEGRAASAEVRWAAEVAQLDETVRSFPGGYATVLGERGINLSGGQKQRAALARALARRPHVVLLDDALSAVDTHTEAEILRALRETLAGRTALIASHRVSAIRDAVWIIVLDEGRIVEQGRHAELLAAGGRYWALLRRQQMEEAIDEDDGAGDALAQPQVDS